MKYIIISATTAQVKTKLNKIIQTLSNKTLSMNLANYVR